MKLGDSSTEVADRADSEVKEITVYEASDGQQFSSRDEALEYQGQVSAVRYADSLFSNGHTLAFALAEAGFEDVPGPLTGVSKGSVVVLPGLLGDDTALVIGRLEHFYAPVSGTFGVRVMGAEFYKGKPRAEIGGGPNVRRLRPGVLASEDARIYDDIDTYKEECL